MASVTYVGGVILALGTSFMNACGLSLQKLSHKRRSEAEKRTKTSSQTEKVVPYFRDMLWAAGLVFMVVGSVASLGVFALLGQSRSACFASVTIVWNLILSSIVLRERATFVDVLVATTIVAGSVVSVIFGSIGAEQQAQNTLPILIASLSSRTALYGALIVIAIFLACVAQLRWQGRWEARAAVAQAQGVTSDAAGAGVVCYTGSPLRPPRMLECAARALMAGLFAGTTGVCSKIFVVGIVAAVGAGDAGAVLTKWQWYCAVFALPCSLICQVHMLNSALKRFSALEAVPLYQTAVSLSGLAFGWTFFNESAGVSPVAATMFLVGCCVSCAGVCLLLFKAKLVRVGDGMFGIGGGTKESIPLDSSEGTHDKAAHNVTVEGLSVLSNGDSSPPHEASASPSPLGPRRCTTSSPLSLSRPGRGTRASSLHPSCPYVAESFYIADAMQALAQDAVSGMRAHGITATGTAGDSGSGPETGCRSVRGAAKSTGVDIEDGLAGGNIGVFVEAHRESGAVVQGGAVHPRPRASTLSSFIAGLRGPSRTPGHSARGRSATTFTMEGRMDSSRPDAQGAFSAQRGDRVREAIRQLRLERVDEEEGPRESQGGVPKSASLMVVPITVDAACGTPRQSDEVMPSPQDDGEKAGYGEAMDTGRTQGSDTPLLPRDERQNEAGNVQSETAGLGPPARAATGLPAMPRLVFGDLRGGAARLDASADAPTTAAFVAHARSASLQPLSAASSRVLLLPAHACDGCGPYEEGKAGTLGGDTVQTERSGCTTIPASGARGTACTLSTPESTARSSASRPTSSSARVHTRRSSLDAFASISLDDLAITVHEPRRVLGLVLRGRPRAGSGPAGLEPHWQQDPLKANGPRRPTAAKDGAGGH